MTGLRIRICKNKSGTHLEYTANLCLIAKVEVVLQLPLVQLQGKEIRQILHNSVGGGALNINTAFVKKVDTDSVIESPVQILKLRGKNYESLN